LHPRTEQEKNGRGSQLTCRICGYRGTSAPPLATPEMWRCAGCGSVQVIELPSIEELQKYYAEYNEGYTAGMGARYQVEMSKRFRAKLDLIQRTTKGQRLLDVGSGEGLFLRLAAESGFSAVGCDYSLRSTYAPSVEVVQGTLDHPAGLPFPDQSFDIVTMWAVIEHMRDPAAALQEIRRVLKPGGYLFCDTPLCGQAAETLAAGRSHWFCPPEHLHVFSARGLLIAHEHAGFVPLRQYASFERNAVRFVARAGRNFLVGVLAGGLMKLFDRDKWEAARIGSVTQIGDIQLLVSRAPE
jgi:SAM-dependent methyltransferase